MAKESWKDVLKEAEKYIDLSGAQVSYREIPNGNGIYRMYNFYSGDKKLRILYNGNFEPDVCLDVLARDGEIEGRMEKEDRKHFEKNILSSRTWKFFYDALKDELKDVDEYKCIYTGSDNSRI